MTWGEAAIRWYAVLLAGTWALAPLALWLCRALADRGATMARPLALLSAIYPVWLLATLGFISFGAAPIVVTVLVGAAAGWSLLIRGPGLDRAWLRSMLLAEAAALVLFLVYVWLRGYTPQILGTEKPMDVAFLASAGRATSMPPPDPWFGGEGINYYYLGYVVFGSVGRLSGVPPEFGFNLVLATVFSMVASASFGVSWNVVRPQRSRALAATAGLFAAFGLVMAGNLYAPLRLLQDAHGVLSAWWWDSAAGIGWRSSRIVCDGPRAGNLCQSPSVETINEFPAFSFLLGDLHPHLMALPFTIVVLGLAWNLAQLPTLDVPLAGRAAITRVLLTGVVAGSLLALNTWDYPTFLLAAGLGLVAAGGSLTRSWRSLAILGGASLLAWLPYLAQYDPPTAFATRSRPILASLPVVPALLTSVGIHLGERTSAGEYLTIFGVPYLVGVIFVGSNLFQRDLPSRSLASWTLLISAAGVLVAAALLAAPVLALCGLPLILAVGQLVQRPAATSRVFVLGLLSLAWFLSVAVEVFYVRDAFESRMNTLFKFYFQVWTLYAIAAAVALALLWAWSPIRLWRRTALAAFTGAALIAGAAYPMVASFQWTEHFTDWRGLDGLAYGQETNPGDVAAIRWLADHGKPGDIILEAAGCSYRPFGQLPFNRVSAFTGLPTVIGWANHERQWRAGQSALLDEITARQDDVQAMYEDPSSPLFDAYGVRWLIVGEYEQGSGAWTAECPAAGPYPATQNPDYPGSGWSEAFRSGNTRIFERVPG